MGCDGGTIPRRDELVRVKKKPEQKDKDAEREARWLNCALTQQRLQEPIAMCGLGRLYSRQNVIEALLEKDKMPDSARHIKNMKDIKTLNLTPNPTFVPDEDKTEGLLDTRHAPYICKLVGLEMSGKFRFSALWNCGCVMSERALKQIHSNGGACPLCQTPFNVEDVVVMNGTEEDIEMNEAKIEMRAAKRKATKKDKKEKKKEKCETTVTSDTSELKIETKEENVNNGPSTSKVSSSASTSNGSSGNANSKLKLVAKLKRLGEMTSMEDPELKRLKTDYSVAKDPKATDVYKSLFTTHKSEKEQSRAHWVTYNPFYN